MCTISFLYLIWGYRLGIIFAGASHRGGCRVVGGCLGIRQGNLHKILTCPKQRIFSYRIKQMASVKFPHLKIGPDIDLVCPTSSFFSNILMTSNWMRAIRRLCSIQSGRALTKINRWTPPAQVWGSLEYRVWSLALCCFCHPQIKTPLVCYFHRVLL